MKLLQDRAAGGRQLAARLTRYADRPDVTVLALPRGGVPVAFEVAHALRLPLDVLRSDITDEAAPAPGLAGRVVIIVDDGMVTGATMLAAVKAVRQRHPRLIIAAAPLASLDAYYQVSQVADGITCLATPEPFDMLRRWYGAFPKLDEPAVSDLIRRARYGLPDSAEPQLTVTQADQKQWTCAKLPNASRSSSTEERA